MWQTVERPKKGRNKNVQRKENKQNTQPGNTSNQQKQAPIPVPQTQPAKPNNKTNRVRDINNKGATKEGTDMDAFNDKPQITEVNNATIASDILNANNVTPNNPNDKNENVRKGSLKNENTRTDNSKNDNGNTDRQTIKSEYKPITLSKGKCVTDIVKDVPKPIKITAPVETVDEPDRAAITNDKVTPPKIETNNKVNTENDGNSESKLQLPYKDGQWSPANPQGKKIYERDFLIALKDDAKSRMKPKEPIPDSVAVDLDKRVGDITRYPISGRPDFTPSFSGGPYSAKSSSLRGGANIGKRKSLQGSSGGNNKNSSKKVVSISLKEDVKLHETENAWKPARFIVSEHMTDDDKRTEALYKRVRGILNKLTPQKFDILVNQVRELNIGTIDRLQGVIDLVFEKAVDEPNFSEAYANMCKELALMTVPMTISGQDDKNEEDNKTAQEQSREFTNFRKLLVTRCQLEFEKNVMDDNEKAKRHKEIEECQDPDKKKELTLLLEEDERQIRKKSVGNIRFIGELFKQQMLTVNIMQRCLNNLLNNKDEENLECLCKLLTTVGYDLEVLKKVDLTLVFKQMQEIAHKNNPYRISSRVRFMLQDTIDLRASKWVPRRTDNAPKTMDQIQKEAENEHLTIQAMNSVPMAPRKDERNNSGPTSERKGGRRNANITNDEGWTTTSRNRTTPFSVQSDKLKNKPPQIDEPLGSNNIFCGWARGSNINKPQNAPATNIYSCLDNNLDSEKRMLVSRPSSSREPSYSSKGPSMERYKFDGRGSRSGSQHRDTRESRDMRSAPAPISTKMPPPPPQTDISSRPNNVPSLPEKQQAPVALTEAQTKWLNNRLYEYLQECCSMSECQEEIASLPKNCLGSFVEKSLFYVLEKAKKPRIRTGKLFASLINAKILTLDDFCKSLEESFLSQASDWVIDIPKFWDYVADILFYVVCDNALPFSKLAQMLAPLRSEGDGGKLIEPLFRLFIEDKGPNFLQHIWQKSGCTLKDFIEEKEIENFIKHNKLEFLSGSDVHPMNQSNVTCEQMHDKLLQFFANNESLDVIVNWIIANVGDRIKENQFIRTLATAVFEDSIRDNVYCPEVLKNHYNLIVKFVDNNQDLELQCIIALQLLVNKLEHPKGVLLTMFNDLYEDEIVSQDAFIQWQTSSFDAAEMEGKGVAIKQLTTFFFNISQEMSDGSDEA